ncbi:MAG TPA: organomercurial lyase [Acidimicrobiales bacterium]|jgi:alkylmercury lyase|nr:organomercurial lyase [Acidimicrobiales bacterium]
MTESYACNDPAFLSTVDGYRAFPQLLGLLARGPVDLDGLAEVAGPAGAELARVVRAAPGSEWDRDGRLVGFGITPRPTDYRFLVGGRTLYTWCASDALFFTVILGTDTVAESTCPASGRRIRLEVAPDAVTSVTPPEAVVSQLHRDGLVRNLRSEVCDHGHFFASAASAAGWMAEHPEGRVVSVPDAFAECRAACEELGWSSPETATR